MKTWYRLAIPLFISSLVYACTVTTGDVDDFDDFDDEPTAGSDDEPRAGSGNTGNQGSGAAGKAGSGSTQGGKGGTGSTGTAGTGNGGSPSAGSGGTSGSGGDDLTDLACPTSDLQGTPAPSTEFEQGDDDRYTECLSCLQTNCEPQLKQCYASDPHDACGWGTTSPDGLNELFCYVECLVGKFDDFEEEDEKHYACATECGSLYDGKGKACNPVAVSQSTLELTECLHDKLCDAFCVDAIAMK